jgi:hypothetical protein
MRALHRLPPVAYATSDEPEAMEASLMMAANRQLTHQPPTTWRCYTSLGARGAASSNLHGGWSPGQFYSNEFYITDWLTDENNAVPNNVGHRRWILDPFLTVIAYGRVYGRDGASNVDGAALKVFNFTSVPQVSGVLPDFVAYPFEDYPARYFDEAALLSFGVIADKSSKDANRNVSFAGASVSVRQRGGVAMQVTDLRSDNDRQGLPNNLQFRLPGLRTGVIYDVTISGVQVNGQARTYAYWFRIVA